jgi:DNA-binding transcriptional ArsR family regulator
MSGAEEPIDRETYDLISKSLSHPIRRKILRLLNQKGRMAFSQLRDSLGIDGSHLSYHIGQMGELLKKAEDGSYELSNLGIVAVSLMRDVEELSTKEARKKPEETVTKRPVGLTLLHTGFAAMGVMLLLFILIGLFLFYPSFSLLFPWMREARLILSATSGAAAIMFFTIASGLRGLKAWGWWSAFRRATT